MKKVTILIVLIMCLTLVLSGCKCTHENWTEADCTTPKTCEKCGETEGEPKGHDWKDATCEEPKACKNCDATEGAPLGHVWDAATCDAAKTCQVCKKTEGEPLGHNWVDATCLLPKLCDRCKVTEGEPMGHSWLDATTEAPKTCENCALTEGERIITNFRFKTAACAPYFGSWGCSASLTGEDIGVPGLGCSVELQMHLVLNNDGTMSLDVKLANKDAVEKALAQLMADAFYEEMAQAGYSKAQSDAEFKAAYGMTVLEFYSQYAKETGLAEYYASISFDGVYYANDEDMHIGYSWDEIYDHLAINDPNSLLWEDFYVEEGLDDLLFTRQ